MICSLILESVGDSAILGQPPSIAFRNRVTPDRNSDELRRRADPFRNGLRRSTLPVEFAEHLSRGVYAAWPCGGSHTPSGGSPELAVSVMCLRSRLQSVSAGPPQCSRASRTLSALGGPDPLAALLDLRELNTRDCRRRSESTRSDARR